MYALSLLKLHIKSYIYLQCVILTVLLAFALIAGGVPSIMNAEEVQDDYIDPLPCDDEDNNIYEDVCNDLLQVRNSQGTSAVSSSN